MVLPAHRQAEIGYFAKLAEARCLAIASLMKDFDFQEMAGRAQTEAPNLEFVLVTGGEPRPGYHSIDRLVQDPIEERLGADILPRPDPDLPAVLPALTRHYKHSQAHSTNPQ